MQATIRFVLVLAVGAILNGAGGIPETVDANTWAAQPGNEPTFHGKTLAQWTTDLNHKDMRQRCRAATALGIGPFDAKAVSPLIAALKTPDPVLRRHVIAALGAIGPPAKSALPHLTPLLKEKYTDDDLVTLWQTLGRLGPDGAEALVGLASKEDGRRLLWLQQILTNMGSDAAPAVVKALDTADATSTQFLLETLQRMGPTAAPAVPKILTLLAKQREQGLRRYLLDLLAQIGPRAADAVPILVPLLQVENDRGAAAQALVNIGKPAWPALRKAIAQGPPEVRNVVLECLKPDWDEAFPLLMQHLRKGDEDTRLNAAYALRRFHTQLSDHQSELLELANHPTLHIRFAVYQLIVLAQPLNVVSLRALIARLRDPHSRIRRFVEVSLIESAPLRSDVERLLLAGLEDRDPDVRSSTLEVVRHLPPSEAVVLALCAALKDETLRLEAALAIATLGKPARQVRRKGVDAQVEAVVPPLLRLIRDPDLGVRTAAGVALCLIECPTEAAVRLVAERIANPPEVRDRLSYHIHQEMLSSALRASGGLGAVAVPILIKGLKHPAQYVQEHAITALGTLGPHARAAVNDLTPMLDTFPERVITALGSIGGEGINVLGRALEGINDQVILSICRKINYDMPDAKQVIPTLRRLACKPSGPREVALYALGNLKANGEDYRKELTRFLNDDSSPTVRCQVCFQLGRFGPAATASLPAIRLLLLDRSTEVRLVAVTALQAIDPTGKVIMQDIVAMLAERDDAARVMALTALGSIQTAAKPVLPRIRECLKDHSPDVAIEAALALFKISGDKRESLSVLREIARTAKRADRPGPALWMHAENLPPMPSIAPRVRAAEVIYQIEKSRDAVDRLVQFLSNEDEATAQAAADAIERLGPDAKDTLPAVRALLRHRSYEVRMTARVLLMTLAAKAKSAERR